MTVGRHQRLADRGVLEGDPEELLVGRERLDRQLPIGDVLEGGEDPDDRLLRRIELGNRVHADPGGALRLRVEDAEDAALGLSRAERNHGGMLGSREVRAPVVHEVGTM
jgi:hypothetical protein